MSRASPIRRAFQRLDGPGEIMWVPLVSTAVAFLRAIQEEVFLGEQRSLLEIVDLSLACAVVCLVVVSAMTVVARGDHHRFLGVASAAMLLFLVPVPLDALLRLVGFFGAGGVVGCGASCGAPWLLSRRCGLGELGALVMLLLFLSAFVGWRTGSWKRAALFGCLLAVALAAFGWLWSASARRLPGFGAEGIRGGAQGLVGILITFCLYVGLRFAQFRRSLVRLNNALIFGLMAGIGCRALGAGWQTTAMKIATITFAAFLVFLSNDYYDREDDGGPGSRARPVDEEMNLFLSWMQLVLAIYAVFAFGQPGYLVGAALVAGLLYHHPSIRLKRIPGFAYLVEGLTATICFYFGTREPTAKGGIALGSYMAVAFVGFALGSMMKDWKDVEQDRAASIPTIYALALGDAVRMRRLHVAVCVLLGCVMSAPFALITIHSGFGVGAAVLLALAVLAPVLLLTLSNPRTAVGLAFLCVNATLALFIALMPSGVLVY